MNWRKERGIFCIAGLAAVLFFVAASCAVAQDEALPTGDEIVSNVNARDDGLFFTRSLAIEMTDKRGKTRKQSTYTYRKYYGEEKRSAIFYMEPANVKDTGFLTYDYADSSKDDDQWLYLPALRRVRRISSSNRGDYFLGTDFTYEDMKQDTRLSPADYNWTTLGKETIDGHECYLIEGVPVDEKTAEELGYGRYRAFVDSEIWIQRRTKVTDVNGNDLKTIYSEDIEKIQGIWTIQKMRAENHKSGHSTIFIVSNVDYETAVDDDMFSERALKRGVRSR